MYGTRKNLCDEDLEERLELQPQKSNQIFWNNTVEIEGRLISKIANKRWGQMYAIATPCLSRNGEANIMCITTDGVHIEANC